jgi:hypothetical protein
MSAATPAKKLAAAVEVRLDGARVGVLSSTQAANMLPLIKHVEERDLVPVARAVLQGNELKADVVLSVAKAQDVDPAWLITLGPPAVKPPPPVHDSGPSR